MIAVTTAFAAGVLLLQWQSTLPPLALCCLLPALLYLLRYRGVRLLSAFATGLLWASLQGHWLLLERLDPELSGTDLTLTGVVSSLPEQHGERLRFELDVERLSAGEREVSHPTRVRLSWYRDAPEIHAGERWRLRVRLRPPGGLLNPGGFDYEGWLLQRRIGATGYVREAQENVRLGDGGTRYALLRQRESLRDLISQLAPSPSSTGVLTALVIGDRSRIEREQWELFTATGTSHLIAISGLHIGIIAGLLFALARRLWCLSPRLPLLIPAPQAAAVIALTGALVYAALAGFAIPTQRALLMLAVPIGALVIGRSPRPGHSIAAALLLILIIDPLAVLSAGLWLSFAAVGAILYLLSARLERPTHLTQWGGIQWTIALLIAPLLVARGLQISLVAPLVNLVAVPLFTLLVVPIALAGTLLGALFEPLGRGLLSVVGWIIDHTVELVTPLAEAPFATWQPGAQPSWCWLLALAGTLLLLAPRALPGRALGILMVLPMLTTAPAPPVQGGFRLTMLDVGQGLAMVVRTAHHTLAYDLGPGLSADFNAGEAVVLPYLRSIGVRRIDRLVVSNGDGDHRGGLSGIWGRIEVAEILSGEPAEVGNGARPCSADQRWSWDGVDFRILHPQGGERWAGNDASCVLLIDNGVGRALLTGDIEGAAERALLRSNPDGLRVDLLQVPHHGSRTSSGPALVTATQPQLALISVGHGNRYGLPNPKVAEQWRAAGATLITSEQAGAVEVEFGPEGMGLPQRWRPYSRRYWHAER